MPHDYVLKINQHTMLSQEEYYTAPSDTIFNDVKKCAIQIWNTYDNTYWYATEKISAIKELKNIQDNTLYMVQMFDIHNQTKLLSIVSDETRDRLAKFLNSNNYWW